MSELSNDQLDVLTLAKCRPCSAKLKAQNTLTNDLIIIYDYWTNQLIKSLKRKVCEYILWYVYI